MVHGLFKHAQQAIAEVKKYILEIIAAKKKHEKEEEIENDLLSLMVRTNESSMDKLSFDELVSNTWLFFFAGHDSM